VRAVWGGSCARRIAPFAFFLFHLSASIAAGQTDRVQQYLGLTKATLERPITPDELEAASLSTHGIAEIARLFEESVESSLTIAGEDVTPELGGEATLHEGRLRFVEYPSAVHAVVRRMVELRSDPKALLDMLSATAEGRQLLGTTGGLHAVLFQMTTRPEPTEAQRRAMDQVVASAVAVHFKTWSVDPEMQLGMIRQHDWHGRYVGFWHIHPPRPSAAGWAAGIEPSMEDMTAAVEKGQFLTIVFQPDGFDVYDLSPLGQLRVTDVSRARVFRHRSGAWEGRFRGLRRSGLTREGRRPPPAVGPRRLSLPSRRSAAGSNRDCAPSARRADRRCAAPTRGRARHMPRPSS
jgi:hypothetical protein